MHPILVGRGKHSSAGTMSDLFDYLSSHEVVAAVQKMSHPVLDAFFLAVTHLGDSAFFGLALAFLFWCGDKKIAVRLASLFFLSAIVIYYLKTSLALPRPDPSLVRSFDLDVSRAESFPSGHAAGTTIFWGYLAYALRKRWLQGTALLVITVVGLSRIYLGVHYLRDVLGGIVIALGILALGIPAISFFERIRLRWPAFLAWTLSIALPAAAAFFYRDPRIAKCTGILAGLWLGTLAERKWISYDPAKARWNIFLRTAIGLAGAGLIYGSLKVLPWPSRLIRSFVIHAVVGAYVALIYPLFLKRFSSGRG